MTILGVSVGIGTVLFLVSLGYGLQNIVLNKITTADSLLSLDVSPGGSGMISLDEDSLHKIKNVPEVTEISPMTSLTAQMNISDLTGDGLVYAVSPSFFRLGGVLPSQGKLFGDDEKYGAVISSAGAKLFNIEPKDMVGRELQLTLLLNEKREDGMEEIKSIKRDDVYTIRGVIDDDNSSFVFVPAASLEDMKINRYAQVKIKIANESVMEQVRNQIIDYGFMVSSLSDTIDQAKKIFKIIQTVLALFGLVALIVSAIGMFNTMTVTLLERINEIGIMRSIGASSGDIMRLFLIESVLMGFLGGMGGIAIGYLTGFLANWGVNMMAKNFGGQTLNLFYHPTWFIGFIIAFSSVIGFFTGVYPSRRASKINPLEALRYK